MNLERALGFDERIQDMNFHRQNMEFDILSSQAQLRHQDYLMRNYQDLMHEKNMLRKDLTTEMDLIRKDRMDSRKALLEVRNARQELDNERKRAFMEKRAREIQANKKEMTHILNSYLENKSKAAFS